MKWGGQMSFFNFEQIIKNAIQNAQLNVRRISEYNCDTNLTDEDMLKLQIDWALENGDKKRFIELSKHLKELSV